MAFKRGVSVATAVDTVKSIWKGAKEKDAETLKVDGIDEWGFARKVEIEERIPSLFGELDHDAVIADSTSFGAALQESYVIKHLREVIRQSPTIFG